MGNFEEENEIDILKDNLLIELFKDAEMPQNFELTDEQKDNFLRVLIVTRTNEPASEKLILAQDKFLKTFNEQQKINIDKLQFKNNICLAQNDILNYNVDLLVVATNNEVEDVESLLAGRPSLDNEILFRAGVELKNELLKNANKNLIFAKGFNLNAKFIAKIVLKNFSKENLNFNEQNTDVKKSNFSESQIKANARNLNFDYQNVCEILAENLKTVFDFIKEKELKSVAIDFNSVLNFDSNTNAKIFKDLKKTIENLNKKFKIKVILKNF